MVFVHCAIYQLKVRRCLLRSELGKNKQEKSTAAAEEKLRFYPMTPLVQVGLAQTETHIQRQSALHDCLSGLLGERDT
jgi:hypothetical protein